MKQIRPSTVLLSLALFALLFVAAGCTSAQFSKNIQAAGTANKHIKATFSGWNAHMDYESWPEYQNTNAPSISAPGTSADFSITPTYTIEQKK